jgi:predicted acyl esterase
MSDQTSSDFAEVIEWAAEQDWSNGKVGLLGISYFGGSQWRVAARKPKGLAAIIPWEVSRVIHDSSWVSSYLEAD